VGRAPGNSGPFGETLEAYFLNPGSSLPRSLRIYCWVYPYHRIIVLRSFLRTEYGFRGGLLGDLLKFFPLAFWVVYDQPSGVELKLPELVPVRDAGLNEDLVVRLPLTGLPDPRFPEVPGDSGAVFFGGNVGLTAIPRRRPTAKKRHRRSGTARVTGESRMLGGASITQR